MQVRLSVALAAGAILVLSACDDGTEKRALVPAVLLTAPAGSAPTPAVIIDNDAFAGQPKSFIDGINAGASAAFMARYTTESGGEPGGEYVVYSLPPLARVDTFEQGQSTPTSIVVSRDGDLAVSCLQKEAGWVCDRFELERPLLLTASPIVYPTADELSGATVTADGQREIAGEPVNCWTIMREVAAETRVIRYCLNAGGVVLFAETNSGVVTATEFSGSVNAEDFVLPIAN